MSFNTCYYQLRDTAGELLQRNDDWLPLEEVAKNTDVGVVLKRVYNEHHRSMLAHVKDYADLEAYDAIEYIPKVTTADSRLRTNSKLSALVSKHSTVKDYDVQLVVVSPRPQQQPQSTSAGKSKRVPWLYRQYPLNLKFESNSCSYYHHQRHPLL